jgi:hypothetical protein
LDAGIKRTLAPRKNENFASKISPPENHSHLNPNIKEIGKLFTI